MEVADLEEPLITPRLEESLFGPAIVLDHGVIGEPHLVEIQKCVSEPEDDEPEEAVACPLP
jgi:hypothetical protein